MTSTVRVGFEVAGLGRVYRALGRMKARMMDMRELFEIYERDFYEIEDEHFDLEGRDERWAPLSGRYAAVKRQEYGHERILDLSGDLSDGLTRRGGQGQIRRLSAREMVLGTQLPYAATHHYGTSKRMWIPAPFYMWINGVPKRGLIGWKKDDERTWSRFGEQYFDELWKEAGG